MPDDLKKSARVHWFWLVEHCMERRNFIVPISGVGLCPLEAGAQGKTIPVIGFLSGGAPHLAGPFFAASLAESPFEASLWSSATEQQSLRGSPPIPESFSPEPSSPNCRLIRSSQFERVLNLKTAQALGTTASALFVRVDEVIE